MCHPVYTYSISTLARSWSVYLFRTLTGRLGKTHGFPISSGLDFSYDRWEKKRSRTKRRLHNRHTEWLKILENSDYLFWTIYVLKGWRWKFERKGLQLHKNYPSSKHKHSLHATGLKHTAIRLQVRNQRICAIKLWWELTNKLIHNTVPQLLTLQMLTHITYWGGFLWSLEGLTWNWNPQAGRTLWTTQGCPRFLITLYLLRVHYCTDGIYRRRQQ